MQPVYLVAIRNLTKFLEALRNAQAPDKVGLRFIEELGFTSTNDRLFIPLLKAMRFLDEGGKPTARYHAFLDDTQWKQVLAAGVLDAYPDLFRVNRNAHLLPRDQVSGKIKSLSEGKLSPSTLGNVTKTFLELVKLADFSSPTVEASSVDTEVDSEIAANDQAAASADAPISFAQQANKGQGKQDAMHSSAATSLVYRIEIVLPAVRDQAIYDAIFRSAKEHLFR